MTQNSKLHLSPEQQLIVILSGLNPSETGIDRINSLLAHPLDWLLIQDKADLHGVAPLIYHHLKQLPNYLITRLPDTSINPSSPMTNHQSSITNHQSPKLTRLPNIPSRVLEFFRQQYYENLARNMTLFQELKEILQGLSSRGIRVMVLKGAALAETVYKNLALRPMSDLDLLIRKQDLAEAERELFDSGYSTAEIEFSGWWAERFGGERLYVKCTGFPIYVDIHWNIANCTWMSSNGMKGEVDRIWNEARPMKVAGVNTWGMSVEDEILYTSVHLSAHHLHWRLIWLKDICELTHQYQGQIDWEKMVNRAKQWQVERPVHFTLKYAQEWLSAQIPGKALAELKPCDTNTLETKFLESYMNINGSRVKVVDHFYRFLTLPGIADRTRFLLGAMCPNVTYLRKRHSIPESRIVYFYYLYRPCYILYRASLAFFKFIRLLTSKKVRSSSRWNSSTPLK